jgi:eukaryotic-like serine/threonine-protein kinase
MGFIRYLFSPGGFRQLLRVLAVNIVLLVLLWFGLSWYSDHDDYITVPDVHQMPVDEAAVLLEGHGLAYLVVDSIYDEKSQGGIIVEQSPAAESKVKEGRQVFLTIYRYQPPMETISIEEGEFAQVALIKLQNKGIRYDVRYVPNSNMVGSVISITHKGRILKPGDSIRRGDRVVLTVGEASDGVVQVPDLTGLDFFSAMARLDSLNLMGQGYFEPEAISGGDSALYRVCRQDPPYAADALPVRPGRIVDLWLSKEPCP